MHLFVLLSTIILPLAFQIYLVLYVIFIRDKTEDIVKLLLVCYFIVDCLACSMLYAMVAATLDIKSAITVAAKAHVVLNLFLLVIHIIHTCIRYHESKTLSKHKTLTWKAFKSLYAITPEKWDLMPYNYENGGRPPIVVYTNIDKGYFQAVFSFSFVDSFKLMALTGKESYLEKRAAHKATVQALRQEKLNLSVQARRELIEAYQQFDRDIENYRKQAEAELAKATQQLQKLP